jgi:hypothetical protein
MATRKAIASSNAKLMAAYPMMASDSPQIIAARCELWLEIGGDIDDNFWIAAVNQIIADAKDNFPPSVGMIRGKALALMARAQPEADIDAARAWQQLARYLISDGVHGGPAWRNGSDNADNVHPLARTAAQRFGERRFVNRMEDDNGTDFAQFRGIFEALQKREAETVNMLPAVRNMLRQLGNGLADTSRQLSPPPRAIGLEPINHYRRNADAPAANPELASRVNAFMAKIAREKAS